MAIGKTNIGGNKKTNTLALSTSKKTDIISINNVFYMDGALYYHGKDTSNGSGSRIHKVNSTNFDYIGFSTGAYVLTTTNNVNFNFTGNNGFIYSPAARNESGTYGYYIVKIDTNTLTVVGQSERFTVRITNAFSDDENIYVTREGSGTLYVYKQSDLTQVTNKFLFEPSGSAFGLSQVILDNDFIYASGSANSNSGGIIYKRNKVGSAGNLTNSNNSPTTAMCFTPQGHILASKVDGTLLLIDKNTMGTIGEVVASSNNSVLSFRSLITIGNDVYGCSSNLLYKINPSTLQLSDVFYLREDLSNLTGSKNELFVGDRTAGIAKFDKVYIKK